MENLKDIDISGINNIIKKIIKEIGTSRDQILNIVDNLRNEHERLKDEVIDVKKKIRLIIEEVDELEKQDKIMRQKLAEVSRNFNKYTEKDIKEAYEKASDMRILFITKQNEEKNLREKRDQLELSLKRSIESIESGEKIINQIGIALGYLEGDILSTFEGAEQNSEMFMGIKILEAQENERKRIARDIHDGPAQHMANIVMKVDICKMIIQKDLNEGLKELDDLKESVKVALKEVRNIIFDLSPMSLDDLGLNKTIEETVKAITQETNIKIDYG